MRYLLLVFILYAYTYALPLGLSELISRSGIQKKDLSISIKEAGKGGKTLASLNSHKRRNPASVIKVFTTYSSILKLGFDYRWRTRFFISGSIVNGTLEGNLYIKGNGDPTLGNKHLESISQYIKDEGIREILGDIVIDRSNFKIGNQKISDFDEYPYSPYNALPDAMMFNERVSTVCLTPSTNQVEKKSLDESYKIINKVKQVNKPCRGKYRWPKVVVDRSYSETRLWLKGDVSKKCGVCNISKILTLPYKSFYHALKDRLHKDGIWIAGGLKLKRVPVHAKELFSHYSDTLEEIVSITAKDSNNIYARHILLLLGAKMYGYPTTLQKGRDAIVKILHKKHALSSGVLKLDNGSGLSRSAKITSNTLVNIFDHAYDKYGKRWLNTLSIAGKDGTLKRRFAKSQLRDNMWMKTGTLKNVKNIGGYLKSKNNTYYTVVLISNSKKSRTKNAKLQNDILEWLYNTNSASFLPQHNSKMKEKVPFQKLLYGSQNKKTSTKTSTKKSKYKPKLNTKGRYYIQLGAYTSKPNSQFISNIKNHGYDYKIIKTKYHKVMVGPFNSRQIAAQELSRVKKYLSKNAFINKF